MEAILIPIPLQVVFALAGMGLLALLTSRLAGKIRQTAMQRGWLDFPNERSSHDRPVPRVGGLSIVVTVLGGVLLLALFVPQNVPWYWTLFVSGSMIVLIGMFDDLFEVRKRIRITVHFLAAVVIVLYIGARLEIVFPKALELTGIPAMALIVLYVVWNINSYNFMDGIDGLAGGHAALVGLVMAGIAWGRGSVELAVVYLLISGASLGFLRWNWHPAKIFMGDLCSGFLGVTLAVTSLWGKLTETVPLTAFLILMAYFYTDSGWTTFRRIITGERFTQPHRDFAFQHAIRAGHSHAKVTRTVLLVELLWLTPLAIFAVILGDNRSIPVLVVAYLPVFIGVLRWKAGVRLDDGQDPDALAEQNGSGENS